MGGAYILPIVRVTLSEKFVGYDAAALPGIRWEWKSNIYIMEQN